ncbi:hypothetical protein BsWGS_19684 [Bradybaena similaris]
MGHLLSDAIHYLIHQYICMNYDIVFFLIFLCFIIWSILKKVYRPKCEHGLQNCLLCYRFQAAKGNPCG